MINAPKQPFVIGFFGFMAIVSAFLILLFVSTFGEQIPTLLTAVVLMLVGLFMSFITSGIKFEPLSAKQFFKTLMWTAMSFVAMLIVNKYVPFTIELSIPLSARYFGVLMGVAEECFFRVWLCGMIYRMGIGGKYNPFIAIGASSLVWSIYHISRYGGSFNILMLIFFCGCILGASFIYSKQADSSILSHALVNWM